MRYHHNLLKGEGSSVATLLRFREYHTLKGPLHSFWDFVIKLNLFEVQGNYATIPQNDWFWLARGLDREQKRLKEY